MKAYSLNGDWKFKVNKKKFSLEEILPKEIKKNQWLEAQVPGTVHTDLLKNKLIPDPFFADNEIKLKWIPELSWIYKKEFSLPKNFLPDKKIFIVFEGLDTVTEIFLNGNKIGKTKNMFCKYEFEISKYLKKKKNKLEIFFEPPLKYARDLELKYGQLPVALNSERVYIRKAQYSFGWDWGPSFPTSGIWKNVFLMQRENNFIEDFHFRTISIHNQSALVEISGKINFAGDNNFNKDKTIFIKFWNINSSLEFSFPLKENKFSHQFNVPDPKLWQPNGFGEPSLYNLQIQLKSENEIIDEKNIKAGIRIIRLQLNEDNKKTFKLVINGNPIFAKGADWIPADSFLPEITDNKYRKLLTFAKNANMNIIRVWGGGIYENNIFYELCDELGLMVWQDFMFACASYPEFDEFILNVKEEAVQNINRLKNHSCMAVWCGNNENEWLWVQQQKKSYKEMPGYKIYRDLIPDILKELNISEPYCQSSPFGDEEDPNSILSGNRHQWEMWSRWVDYKKVEDDKSLFVTEFGFQGPANQKTLEKVIPQNQRNPQSYLFEFHNKQIEGNERVFKFLASHLPVKTEWKDFIYLAQLNQGLALKTCIEHWRLNPETNGSIIWQLNDCWPVTSWSLIDSELNPKLSYYLSKESFSDLAAILKKNNASLEVYVLNDSNNDEEIAVKIQLISLLKNKAQTIISKKIKICSSEKKLLSSIFLSEEILNGEGVIISSIYNAENQLIHRNYYLEKEWKYINLPKAKVKIKDDNNKKFIEVTSDRPAFFVSIESLSGRDEELIFKKNGLIILPGEKINVEYEETAKLKNKKFSITTLNDHLIYL